MRMLRVAQSLRRNAGALRDSVIVGNPRVLLSLLGPAVRGFVLEAGKGKDEAILSTHYDACFNLRYGADEARLEKLYTRAKQDQWDGDQLPWQSFDPGAQLFDAAVLPLGEFPGFHRLPEAARVDQVRSIMSWFLSQILHGEQGALFASCQITEALHWMDGKLYAATQVVDEARHVEVFKRYLNDKLGKRYELNDNLYVILDTLMTDSRWDMKFLGMQILVEGLALAAFGVIRQQTAEPLLRELLRYVITDEARHVHFGVVALENYYQTLTASERREREDWAFEMAVLMRNRFLAHEFYDEYWAHAMSRREWDRILLGSAFMHIYRRAMYRRIVPNLKRIGLLSDRIRPYYEKLGLLEFEHAGAAPEWTVAEMLACT
jgi:hypothetical protein